MKFLHTIGSHILDWLEAYFWAPMAIILVILSAHLYYSLTGRPPADPPDFIPNMAGRFVLAILAIVLTSVTKEALIGWLTHSQKIANQTLAIAQLAATVVILVLWAYTLAH